MISHNFCFSIYFLIFFKTCNSLSECQFQSNTNSGSVNQAKNYRAYQNSTYCTPEYDIQEPTTQAQVIRIVRDAITFGKKVKAFGSRHSITDIICTDGVPICMRGLNKTQMMPDGVNVTVEAGATLRNLTDFLHKFHGRALIHIPTFSRITIGGAIATGAHGSSLLTTTSISELVVGIKYINGRGRVLFTDDPREIRGFMLHLGLLGVILEVKLKTVPQFKLKIDHKEIDDHVLDSGWAPYHARKFHVFELFWFPTFGKVVVGWGNETNEPGDAVSNFIPELPNQESSLLKESFELIQATKSREGAAAMEFMTKQSLLHYVPGKSPIFAQNGTDPPIPAPIPAIGFSHVMMTSGCDCLCPKLRPQCMQCLWNEEVGFYDFDESFSMDVRNFTEIVRNIRAILRRVKTTFPMQGIYIRFTGKSPALMSRCHDRECVHFEWISMKRVNDQDPRLGLDGYQAISHSLIKYFDARPHYGKNGPTFHTGELLTRGRERNLELFKRMMRKNDRDGVFMNNFGERLIGSNIKMDIYPNITRCALSDSCTTIGGGTISCTDSKDCGSGQTCSRFELSHLGPNAFVNVCRDNFIIERDPMFGIEIPNNFLGLLQVTNKTLSEYLANPRN